MVYIAAMGRVRKPLRWFDAGINTPPFTEAGRLEAGTHLRLLQEGESLGLPHARPMPAVGPRCGELRVRDGGHNWRIVYRVDADAILILDVFPKKTRQTPKPVIDRCRERLAAYDAIEKASR